MATFKKTIMAATLAAISCATFADGSKAVEQSLNLKGLYIDAGVGTNFIAYDIKGYKSGVLGQAGANVNVGYQVNDYLAPELGYTYYGFGLQGIDAALKGIIPLHVGTYGASIFGKIGAAHLFNANVSSTAPLLGLGFGVGVTKNVDWNVQAQAVISNYSNGIYSSVGLLSTGLTYHFG